MFYVCVSFGFLERVFFGEEKVVKVIAVLFIELIR